jgi:hypothetical protein
VYSRIELTRSIEEIEHPAVRAVLSGISRQWRLGDSTSRRSAGPFGAWGRARPLPWAC